MKNPLFSKALQLKLNSSWLKPLALAAGVLGMGTALQADAAKGKQLYAMCAACHGSQGEGNAMMKAPALVGLQDWYLKKQLQKFKDGVRGSHPKDLTGLQMKPMAMTLADEAAVDAVLSFLKTQPVVKPKASLDGDAVKGKTYYMTCQACHGEKGEGNQMFKAPALKSLPDWYIVAQLKKYKEKIRGAHPADVEGAMMRPMADTLADEKAMKDVAAYIQSL